MSTLDSVVYVHILDWVLGFYRSLILCACTIMCLFLFLDLPHTHTKLAASFSFLSPNRAAPEPRQTSVSGSCGSRSLGKWESILPMEVGSS